MRGDATVELGRRLLGMRAHVNEQVAVHGPTAVRTLAAQRKLFALQVQARRLFR